MHNTNTELNLDFLYKIHFFKKKEFLNYTGKVRITARKPVELIDEFIHPFLFGVFLFYVLINTLSSLSGFFPRRIEYRMRECAGG